MISGKFKVNKIVPNYYSELDFVEDPQEYNSYKGKIKNFSLYLDGAYIEALRRVYDVVIKEYNIKDNM